MHIISAATSSRLLQGDLTDSQTQWPLGYGSGTANSRKRFWQVDRLLSHRVLILWVCVDECLVLEEINHRRLKHISSTIDSLHDEFNKRLSDWRSCDFLRRAMIIGSLARVMHLKGIFSPKPTAPFLGISLYDIEMRFRAFSNDNGDINERYRHDCWSIVCSFSGGQIFWNRIGLEWI